MIIRKPRRAYLLAGVAIFVVELIIALFVRDRFIRPYLGDALVVGLIYCVLMSYSRWRAVTGIIFTLLFSYAVEVAQYFRVIYWLGLEDYRWARIIIGTSFSWEDLVMYTLGAIAIYVVEKLSS